MSSALALISEESRLTGSAHPIKNASSLERIPTSAHHQGGLPTKPSRSTDAARPPTPQIPQESALGLSPNDVKLRGGKAVLLTIQLTALMLTNSFTTGIMTIAVTVMAKDLALDPSLVYWPVLACTLTSSPLMLPFGSIADVLGPKPVNLAGCLGCGIFFLACGFTRTGTELIVFRGAQGIASALVMPTSMSIVSSSLANGKLRNISLASLGLGQVIGYALGLVLGGVFVQTVGWRFGFYLVGGLQLGLSVLGLWAIPGRDSGSTGEWNAWSRLKREIDWIGACISCACIAMLSYVLAVIARDSRSIRQPANVALLALSFIMMPTFAAWMHYQERRGKPALMPNSLWRTTFVSLCIMVTFIYAGMQCMELLTSLFFQNVQKLSPLDSSIRLLPGLVVGAIAELTAGNFIHKLSIPWLMFSTSLIASIAPLLMALTDPSFPYWYEAFPAQVLYPLSVVVIFVVGALIVSDIFPERDQALAGGVFNTIANLGQAIGLALIAVISNSVTEAQSNPESPEGFLEGYRAGYFATFAWMVLTALISVVGLRKVGKIGLKRD